MTLLLQRYQSCYRLVLNEPRTCIAQLVLHEFHRETVVAGYANWLKQIALEPRPVKRPPWYYIKWLFGL